MEKFDKNAIQIITVDAENKLVFHEELFRKLIGGLKYKIFNKGAVGKMRVGKSTELNNNYQVLTGDKTRLFSELDSADTDTRGIWVYAIEWDKILPEWKEKIMENFGEPIDIILLDCEGTESSNNVATSRLYLINLLINSVINIHVSKAIDQGFATKLSQALISSNELLGNLGGNLKEILPALFVLLKDTNLTAWENAKKANPTLVKYEDLLKSFDDLYNYYNQFPHKEVRIICAPKTDDEGTKLVTCKNSQYWKDLESTLNQNLKFKKLKTKDEFILFIRNVANFINTNNLMNVKTELENFYKSMFEKEKYVLLNQIIQKSLDSFSSMNEFSPEMIRSIVISISFNELDNFILKVSNLSCHWIFDSMSKEIESELSNLLKSLEELYFRKKSEYDYKHEATSQIEKETTDVTKEIPDYEVEKDHGNFQFMWLCCKNTNKNAPGCKSIQESYVKEGNIILNFVSGGLLGRDRIKTRTTNIHIANWGEFCNICSRTRDSPTCQTNVIKKMKQYTETVISGFKKIYTMNEWSNSQFRGDAFNFLMNKIKQL